MTTQMRSYGRGLRMPLLALTASASIVGGVFVAAQPAYSVDGVVGVSGQCLTAADEGASIVVSSVVPVGSPLHVAGSGWGATSETLHGFVIVTLDDGQEVRPDGVTLPAWVPASVVRNKTAWSVAEVSTTGTFSADIELLSTWVVGSEHSIMIADGVTGTYAQVSVTVVEADAQAHACSLTPTDEPSAEPDGHVTSDVVTDGRTESPADDAVDNAAKPVVDLTDDTSSDAGSDASASAPPNAPAPRTTPSADASDDASRSSATPTPSASASSASSSGGNGSSSASGGTGSNADAPSPSASADRESVSASQIGPKAHSEQQATNQAVREQESRLNGWILAGGGLLALLGAIVTVSIVRRSHGPLR